MLTTRKVDVFLKSRNRHGMSWVVKTLVPTEVYTDRTEFLECFYEAALKAATRRTMSTVLVGFVKQGDVVQADMDPLTPRLWLDAGGGGVCRCTRCFVVGAAWV